MSKSNGGTRGSSSNAPRGLSASGWNIQRGDFNDIRATASGADAEELYAAIQSPVERAVESQVGSIRTGGGFSGSRQTGNAEFSLIFRGDATNEQISEYLTKMKEGAKLYAAYNNRDNTQAEFEKAERAFDSWYRKNYKG